MPIVVKLDEMLHMRRMTLTELADRIYIIERGEIRYSGTPQSLAAEPDVREKYLMV